MDPVDELLNEAGEKWRAAQPPPPEVDTTRWSNRNSWLPLGAAAAAILVVAGGVVFATTGSSPPVEVEAAESPDKIVREGSTVRASGTVIVQPDGKTMFCQPSPGLPPDGDVSCRDGVPVTGVNIDQLATPRGFNGVRAGEAKLTGVWRGGVLTVTKQAPPDPLPTRDRDQSTPPCPPPAGGWKEKGKDASVADIGRYISQEHPDRFVEPHFAGNWVFVVGVAKGDIAAETRELQNRYQGNLCVIDASGKLSIAEDRALRDKLEPVFREENNRILVTSGDKLEVELKMLTPELAEKFAPYAAGLDIRPWLRPLLS